MSTAATVQHRFRLFLVSFGLLSTVFSVVLWTVGVVDIETYFVVSFLTLLITSELFAPTTHDSIWWDRLQWVKVGGWIVLAYILFNRVVAVVQ